MFDKVEISNRFLTGKGQVTYKSLQFHNEDDSRNILFLGQVGTYSKAGRKRGDDKVNTSLLLTAQIFLTIQL